MNQPISISPSVSLAADSSLVRGSLFHFSIALAAAEREANHIFVKAKTFPAKEKTRGQAVPVPLFIA